MALPWYPCVCCILLHYVFNEKEIYSNFIIIESENNHTTHGKVVQLYLTNLTTDTLYIVITTNTIYSS